MAEAQLRSAVAWIMEAPGNAQRFRANSMLMKEMFPELTEDELGVMEKIREQSTRIEEMHGPEGKEIPLMAAETTQARSFGW